MHLENVQSRLKFGIRRCNLCLEYLRNCAVFLCSKAWTNTEIWLRKYLFQICHEHSNIRYWITSGIGLRYINIAVAESADHSFNVTLCKHCVRFKRGCINMAEPNRAGTKPGQGHIESSLCFPPCACSYI